MKKIFLLTLATLTCTLSWAFQREIIAVHSEAMNKDIMVRVLLPDGYYSSKESLPVVYVIHGFSDNYKKWDENANVGRFADQYNMIIITPDGGYDSWYFDAPEDPTYRYETFISKELIKYIDSHYKTIPEKKMRAITGQSMGGHGAMYLAIRHKDIFGSVGSTSGGLDIRPFPKNWGISKRLGTIEEHPENWEKHTVINVVDSLKNGELNIVFDCGYDDFFYQVNCNMHEKLLKMGIAHDFFRRPGNHSWGYWSNSIQYHMLYFNNCFRDIK